MASDQRDRKRAGRRAPMASESSVEAIVCGSPPTEPCEKCGRGRKCPKCGGHAEDGYGLMGGGIGLYWLCTEDGCDYFNKEQDDG